MADHHRHHSRAWKTPHQVEVSVDGARMDLVTFGGPADRDLSYRSPFESDAEIDRRLTFRIPIKAGMRSIMATFVWNSETQYDGLLQPFIRTNHDTLSYRGLPAVDWLTVAGPFHRGRNRRIPEPPADLRLPAGHGAKETTVRKRNRRDIGPARIPRPPTDREMKKAGRLLRILPQTTAEVSMTE